MKLVAELDDSQWAKDRSEYLYKPHAIWFWALGDDGELYFRGSFTGYSYEKDWHPFTEYKGGGVSLQKIFEIFAQLNTRKRPSAEFFEREIEMKRCESKYPK